MGSSCDQIAEVFASFVQLSSSGTGNSGVGRNFVVPGSVCATSEGPSRNSCLGRRSNRGLVGSPSVGGRLSPCISKPAGPPSSDGALLVVVAAGGRGKLTSSDNSRCGTSR